MSRAVLCDPNNNYVLFKVVGFLVWAPAIYGVVVYGCLWLQGQDSRDEDGDDAKEEQKGSVPRGAQSGQRWPALT